MRKFFFILALLSPFGAYSQSQNWSTLNVDAIISMNTSTPGTTLTAAIGNAGTVSNTCTVGTSCTFATVPAGFTVGANQGTCSNLGPVQMNSGGALYPAQSLNYNNVAHADSANGVILNYNFSSPISPTAISIGGCFTLGMPGQLNGNDYDYWMVQDLSGHFALLQFTNNCGASDFAARIEIDGGVTSSCIDLIPAETYYFSLNVDTSAKTSSLYVYTWQGTYLGHVTHSTVHTGNVSNVRLTSNENGTDSGTTYMQNTVMNWSTAPDPLFWTETDPWSGVLSPGRAVSWANAGVVGGIPSGAWTQCVTTACNTVTSAGTSATATQITTALASAPDDTYVLLATGTYNLTGSIIMPGLSYVALRGAGANNTLLVFTGTTSCNATGAASICLTSSDNNFKTSISNGPVNWTAGYLQTSNTITLASVTNLKVGNPVILDQCDSGLSTTSCTGTVTDNGAILITDSSSTGTGVSPGLTGPYSVSANAGGAQRTGRQQEQIVLITQCDGNTTVGHSCSSGSNMTISPGLYMPNWSSGQSPQAWWPTTPGSYLGVENLSIDNTNNSSVLGVDIFNCVNCWVKGIRSIDPSRAHVQLVYSTHVTVRDSYFYLTQGWTTASYGFESYSSSDSLIENNIMQAVASPYMLNGPGSGDVFGYNFSTFNFFNTSLYNQNAHGDHTAGEDFWLAEGNQGNSVNADTIHGTHNFGTYFRNRWAGKAVNCWQSSTDTSTSVLALSTGTFGSCNSNYQAISLDSFSRFYNLVGNILGTTGSNTVYESQSNNNPAFRYGLGNGSVPVDPNVLPTTMLWGNCDSATGFGSCRFNSTEVPSGFTTLAASQAFYLAAVPANDNLPASFYYSSKPSWWPSAKAWPVAGPDVSGGNVSNVNGTVYTNPAQDCYLNTMGGPANGQSTVLAFDASVCYSSSSTPVGASFGGSNAGIGHGASVGP